jgi:hypothetical protein
LANGETKKYQMELADQLKNAFGGMCTLSHRESIPMRKGTLAQEFLASRKDVQDNLKKIFIDKLKNIGVTNINFEDIVINTKPGICVLFGEQFKAATPDILIYLAKDPSTVIVGEIKFTADYSNTKLQVLYTDQVQFQIQIKKALGAVLLLADASACSTLDLVETVASVCDVNAIFFPPDLSWQKDTNIYLKFLLTFCTVFAPQLLNGHDQLYNVVAPACKKKAVALIGESAISRKGRTLRKSGCQCYVTGKFVDFDVPPSAVFVKHARKCNRITSEEALQICRRIQTCKKSGIYLMTSELEHHGCSRPIGKEAQYSPEKWESIYKKISDLNDLGVSHSKIALMLNKEYGLLDHTSHHVESILCKLSHEKLASTGQILVTTNSDNLISALDNLSMLSIVLFDIIDLRRSVGVNLVMQVLRVSGFAGNEQKVSYLEFQNWGILSRDLPNSLLKCYQDPTASFPSNSSSVQPYLYHFSSFIRDQDVKVQNPTKTQAVVKVIAWISVSEMLRVSKCPEVLINDSTCKLCSGNFKLNCSFSEFPDGTTATFLKALLTETKAHFQFIFKFVLPIIYGELICLVTNVIVDGNPQVYAALEDAKLSGKFGNCHTFISNCFFHGVTQVYLATYASQHAGLSAGTFKKEGFRAALEANVCTDGGIGRALYEWIKYGVYEVISAENWETSLTEMYLFLNREQISSDYVFPFPDELIFTERHKAALLSFLDHCITLFPKMSRFANCNKVSFNVMTTSRAEGNFSPMKKTSNLTSASTPVQLLKYTKITEEIKTQNLKKKSDRDCNAIASGLLHDSPDLADVLRWLTPKIQDTMKYEILRSKDWNVIRSSLTRFSLRLNKEAVAKFEREKASKHPHLFNWGGGGGAEVVINVVEDVKKIRRLQCPCFLCKQLIVCRRVLAIKGELAL